MSFKFFIQARMSSKRLPGKVLLPFLGKTVIENIVNTVGKEHTVVVTSNDETDNILAEKLISLDIETFRGSLHNVFDRYANAMIKYQPEWVIRICADSPVMSKQLLDIILDYKKFDADLITNLWPRTFPVGHSIELIKTKTFLKIDQSDLSLDEKEHVTRHFYQNSEKYRILNVYQTPDMSHQNLAIDNKGDIERVEKLSKYEIKYEKSSFFCNYD